MGLQFKTWQYRGVPSGIIYNVFTARQHAFLALLTCALMAGFCAEANAATYTWVGAANTEQPWNDANWGGVLPTNTDTCLIENGGTTLVSTANTVCNMLRFGTTGGSKGGGVIISNDATLYAAGQLALGLTYAPGTMIQYSGIYTGNTLTNLAAQLVTAGYTNSAAETSGLRVVIPRVYLTTNNPSFFMWDFTDVSTGVTNATVNGLKFLNWPVPSGMLIMFR
jgi:hypothetical protein